MDQPFVVAAKPDDSWFVPSPNGQMCPLMAAAAAELFDADVARGRSYEMSSRGVCSGARGSSTHPGVRSNPWSCPRTNPMVSSSGAVVMK